MSSDRPLDFIRQIVADDVASGTHGGRVLTRFPPEPNGFLHIGHAAAICLDFGVAEEYGGRTTLRMDDTNPTTEDPAFVEAIADDIRWLGFEWEGEIRYASDYFEALYRMALRMIEDGFAYVDSLSEAEIRAHRGTVTEPGRPSPHRERSVEENLDLFRRMRAGEFEDGAHVVRAKIDLAASNMKMRDPLMYRIRHAHHYRTGDEWPIYPMYDWAHGQSDAIEGITHSFCTLEFDNNRELYDWFIEHTRPAAAGLDEIPGAEGGGGDPLGSWDPRPRQYEFARLNLDYTVVSKRKLKALVAGGHVDGWDDPRMPTLAGLRRRGVTPEAIRIFIDQVGIAKADKRVDIGTFEYAIREALNPVAPRVLCVLDPLRVVIENYEGEEEWLEAPYFPHDVESPPADWPGTRMIPFGREILIERDDFAEDPPKGFRRLAPGREVRLRHGYFLRCREVVRDEAGEIAELRCTYDPETGGGSAPDGRKPPGTIHWVSAVSSLAVEARLYDRLFGDPDPSGHGRDFLEHLNPSSLRSMERARIEPSVAHDPPGTRYQFERQGYFVRDTGPRGGVDHAATTAPEATAAAGEALVFNRTVALRDTWGRRVEGRIAFGDSAAAVVREREPRGTVEPVEVVGEDTGRAERDRARAESPELAARFERYLRELSLPEDVADLLTGERRTADYFEAATGDGAEARAVANWLIHEVRGVTGVHVTETELEPAALATLVSLVEAGEVSRAVAKDLLPRLVEQGGDPAEIVEREGLRRIEDSGRLESVVDRVLSEHPDEIARYRDGQEALSGFFIGQVMRATEGRADPGVVRGLVEEKLG